MGITNDNGNSEFAKDQVFVNTAAPGVAMALQRVNEDFGITQMLPIGSAVMTALTTFMQGIISADRRIRDELVDIADTNVFPQLKNICIQLKNIFVGAGAAVASQASASAGQAANIANDVGGAVGQAGGSFSSAVGSASQQSIDAAKQLMSDIKDSDFTFANLWSITRKVSADIDALGSAVAGTATSIIEAIGTALMAIVRAGGRAVTAIKALFTKILAFTSGELVVVVAHLADVAVDGATLMSNLCTALGRLLPTEMANFKGFMDTMLAKFGEIKAACQGGRAPESLWLGDPTLFPPNFYHFILPDPPATPPPPAPAVGGAGTISQGTPSTFLYLDIGKWGGSRRDFGVVCGATAALCEFQTQAAGFTGRAPAPKTGLPTQLKDPDGSSQSAMEIQEINKILTALHKGNAGGKGIAVIRWMRSNTAVDSSNFFENGSSRPSVFVFLGDMHIPVVTNWPTGELGPKPDPTQERSSPFDVQTSELPGFAFPWNLEDSHGRIFVFNYDVTKQAELQWWYEKYLITDGYTADGDLDLQEFVARMQTAATNQTHDGNQAPWLFQLGDMIDLWIGIFQQWSLLRNLSHPTRGDNMRGVLQNSYIQLGTADSFLKLPFSTAAGLDVAKTWAHSGINPTTTNYSQGILAANSYAKSLFLWGNHDNYFGLRGAAISPLKARQMDKLQPGHFMAEHGHRWDGNNADGQHLGNIVTQFLMIGDHSDIVPFSKATPGPGLTPQAMALNPNLVRWAEPASRLRQIRDATMLWRQNNGSYAVYIMGHTHDPGLAQIYVYDWPDSGSPPSSGPYAWGTKPYNAPSDGGALPEKG